MLKYFENRSAFDVINIIVGLGLALSPWYLGYTAETYAAWNAWIVGAAVAIIASIALVAFFDLAKWTNLGLGLWAIVAPWLLSFAHLDAATIAHVVAGLVIAFVAARSLWSTPGRPYSTA